MPFPTRLLRDPRGLAVGRTAVGLSMLAQPGLVPGTLGVDRASRDRMDWAVQMLGAREVALGLGTLLARDRRLWLLGGLLSDAVDALAVGRATRQGRLDPAPGAALTAVAGAAVVIGLGALLEGPRREPALPG